MMLVDWNGEAKHSTKGTARREKFIESSTELLKRHEKITHLFYTGACVTCKSGKGTDLPFHETYGSQRVRRVIVGTAEGDAALSWQIPDNVYQRRRRRLETIER